MIENKEMTVTRTGKAKKRRNHRRRILAGRGEMEKGPRLGERMERLTHWEFGKTGPHPVLVKMLLPLSPMERG